MLCAYILIKQLVAQSGAGGRPAAAAGDGAERARARAGAGGQPQVSDPYTLKQPYQPHRAVLVGDPQQLPATVLSARARELALERSLFERLQAAGCPCRMLSVQYRMQPPIREFPSRHFYAGRLVDGDSVLAAPPPPFYEHPLLKPYVVFDVASGREQRHRGGGSLRNQVH